jgi:hypothetical protein
MPAIKQSLTHPAVCRLQRPLSKALQSSSLDGRGCRHHLAPECPLLKGLE